MDGKSTQLIYAESVRWTTLGAIVYQQSEHRDLYHRDMRTLTLRIRVEIDIIWNDHRRVAQSTSLNEVSDDLSSFSDICLEIGKRARTTGSILTSRKWNDSVVYL